MIWSKRYRLSMSRLNCPDSISSLKCPTVAWSSFGRANMTLLPPNNGVMSTKIRNRGPLRQEIHPPRPQQAPTPAERALADRIEDRFVSRIVFSEFFGRVGDDSVGAPAPCLPAVR